MRNGSLQGPASQHFSLVYLGRLHIQGDPGDRAELDHEAVEAGLASGGLDDLTAGRNLVGDQSKAKGSR